MTSSVVTSKVPVRRFLAVAASAAVVLVGATSCSKPAGSTKAFCAQVRQVPALESVLARFSETDPDLLQDRIDKARTAYNKLIDAAPSSIRTETEEVVTLVDDILGAVEDNPTDPAKAADQLRKAMADHPDVAGARATVAAFAEKECDVQLDATLTDTPPATTTTTTAADDSTTEVSTTEAETPTTLAGG